MFKLIHLILWTAKIGSCRVLLYMYEPTFIVMTPVEIIHSDWITAIFSVPLQMNITCHMTPMAHGHGVR